MASIQFLTIFFSLILIGIKERVFFSRINEVYPNISIYDMLKQ